ncbi:hypothetical protein COCMIDRAFT_100796 [Bipolaris oryzae ATCC 44560]|uniref:Thioredoxin domain-containing protein n=1 Tax=Bipolaris oryzae ATCC 44560 TaxID=930090 RepID=W6Z7B6_COCMI|nr:uncharacterized protein COCMIDRAFT_100796 [Bipolaris oryzae ATCC 44560]EUC43464.1 hypothetical protein COCMIDRAFT_100796 [Bipolaris oryzae ATCC 44560]
METSEAKATAPVPPPIMTSTPQPPATQVPSPPHSQSGHGAYAKPSMDVAENTTPPFSPSSQTPVLGGEQEEFEGTLDVNNDIPTEKELSAVADMLVLDAQGQSRPFKELYQAPHVASRQLIIFIRHFFCGNCQEYLRTLASSITPDDLLALPTPTFITVIGCGRPELIPMYTETTGCPFPIYADPTRKLYDHLGMTRTLNLGAKPQYMQTNVLINSVQSIFQGLSTGRKALKGGDFKQVGGEFLFENGECTWAHRMKTTRGHAEVSEIRSLIGLDSTRPPVRRRWSHEVKGPEKNRRRTVSWGRLRSKSKSGKDVSVSSSKQTTPDRILEEENEAPTGSSKA